MKYLILPVGSHGDVHPLLGIALGLKRRGHEVVLATNGHFRGLVEAAGVRFAELGTDEEFRRTMGNAKLWSKIGGFKAVMQEGVLPGMGRMVEYIRAGFDPKETVIVAAAIAFGARIAQDRWGYRVVTTQLQPSALRTEHANPKLPGLFLPQSTPRFLKRAVWGFADRVMIDPIVKGPINAERAKWGLGPVRRGVLDGWWHSPDRVLGLWPAWYAPVQPDWPGQLRLTGFPMFDERGVEAMDPGLERFLEAGDRPVAFTPGSANVHGGRFFAESAEACRRIGRRGILLTRHGEQIPRSLPDGVIHVRYAPFSELLPRCCALVHHGGIGTTAQALAAGCVQVVVPLSHDQPDNGERMQRLGVGRVIGPGGYKARRVARVLGEMLGDGAVRLAAAARVAGNFVGADGIGAACDEIERVR